MISKEIIIDSIQGLDKTLFSELLDEHEGFKKAYLKKDYEKCLLKAGKFVEALFQNLEYIRTGKIVEKPNFNEIEENLKNAPNDIFPDEHFKEAMCSILPKVGKIVYIFRSKRGGAHRGIDPLEIDATFCYNSSKFIISEIVRLYSSLEENVIRDYLGQVLTADLPFVEEFEDGRITVLIDTGSCKEDILLVLYNFYAQRLTNEDIKKHLLEFYTSENITTSLASAIKIKLVDRNENGSILTRKGIKYVEEKYRKQEIET